MKCTISRDKAFKIMEWIFFIGFSVVAGCFASGVLEQFFSQKTSFSQHEEEFTMYPVITLDFFQYQALEVNITNVKFIYSAEGMNYNHKLLEIGENHFPNNKYNKTEKVILESLETFDGRKAFRIIHTTPILDNKRPGVGILMYTLLEKKNNSFSDLVEFYLTSLDNSPGFIDATWKDGQPLQIAMLKNTYVRYNMRPQKTKYLEQLGNCQKEAYYECIASELDVIEFNECTKKCIPNVFSNMGKNYSTPFCQNDTVSQQCILNHILKQKKVGSKCKKSCSNLEYFGEVLLNCPYQSEDDDYENWNVYWLQYKLTNLNLVSKVWEEYVIYDIIGMIGSVGGTLGIFYRVLKKKSALIFKYIELRCTL